MEQIRTTSIINPIYSNNENNTEIKKSVTNPIQQKTNTSDKKKMVMSVAAGACITALAIGGILVHKNNSSSIKKLAEKIEFKQATTLEDAINFGKQNLGIKKYKGFKETDLDVLNWVNEGLVKVNNKAKGKAVMPEKVNYVENIVDSAASMNLNGKLEISRKYVNEVKNDLNKFLNTRVTGDEARKEEIRKKIKDFGVCKAYRTNVVNKQSLNIGTCQSPFAEIYHEMGHLQHANALNNNALFRSLGKKAEQPKNLDKDAKKLRELFDSNEHTAKSISDYANASPLEFVAECYSKMCNGEKLSEEALNLYKQLHGVMI